MIRLVWQKGETAKTVLSQVTSKTKKLDFKTKIGISVDAGQILANAWFQKDETQLDAIYLCKITGMIPGLSQ